MSWLEGRNWRAHRQTPSVPLALWLGMGAAGCVAVAVLAQTPQPQGILLYARLSQEGDNETH